MEVQHLEPMEKKQIKTLHNILSCVKLVFSVFLFHFQFNLASITLTTADLWKTDKNMILRIKDRI